MTETYDRIEFLDHRENPAYCACLVSFLLPSCWQILTACYIVEVAVSCLLVSLIVELEIEEFQV